MTKKIYIFLLLLVTVHSGFGQSYPEYIYRSITFQGTTLPYRLFIPDNYSAATKYPVMLALHGWGESGTDNDKQLTKTRLAVSWSESASQSAHPCFVVVPQTNSGWDNNAVAETLAALLDALIAEFSIDSNRQYITGLSMGGQGTWYMVNKYPNRFAAAIPMCGSGNPAAVTSAWKTPIWAFHGTLDETIPVAGSRDMIAALEQVGKTTVYTLCQKANCEGMGDGAIQMHIQSHADLMYTEYQFGTHRIWDISYDNPMLHPWLFSQYRSTPGAINLTNFNTHETVRGIQPIQWQSPAQDESVEIWYSADTGDNWTPVTPSTPDNGTYPWDTQNFNDGAFSLINIFLKNNQGFVYARDQSAYFTIDNRSVGTPFVKILNVDYPTTTNQPTLPLQVLLGDSKSGPLMVRLYYSPDGGQNFSMFDSYSATPDMVPIPRTREVQLSALDDSGNAVIKVEVDNGSNTFSDRTPSFYNRTGLTRQTIAFDPLVPVTYGMSPFVLDATASSGLTVQFTSSDISVATVSGNTVTIVGAGTTSIIASQPGNINYSAAPMVAHTLMVNKGDQTITFNPLTPVSFGDQPFVLTAQSSSGLPLIYTSSNSSVATVSGSTVTIVGAGTAILSASQSGDLNYNAIVANQNLTVSKANQTITFNPLTPVSFGDQPFILTAQSSSGLPLNYTSSNTSVATVSGSTVTIVGAGTTTLSASQSGDLNYNATVANQNLTVNKANQTITFNPLAPVSLGDQPFILTAQSSSGLPLNYISSNTSVATVSGSTVTIVGAGTTTLSASQSGDLNYNAIVANQSLTVNKANQTITFNPLTPVSFGDQPFVLTAQSSSGLPLNYTSSNTSVATVSGSTITIVGAGTTTLSASQSGDLNYNASVANQNLTVNKANQTITFNPLTPVSFGDQPFILTAQSSSGLPLIYTSSNSSVATVSGSTVTIVGAGTTVLSVSQSGNLNYNATVASQNLTINKANQTITFNPLTPVSFGDQRFTLTAQSSSGLPLNYVSSNSSVATVSGSTVTIVGAGITTISAMQQGNLNYHAAVNVLRTLLVSRANQIVFFTPVLNTPLASGTVLLQATSSSGLPINFSSSDPSMATLSGNTATLHSAGKLTFTASQSGNQNYNATAVTQTICVLPDKPTITGNFTNPDAPKLTSSSATGNQWYLNADPIDGATAATYTAADPGIYMVLVEQKGCVSPPSNEMNIVITGMEPPVVRGLYPNPAVHEIMYSGSGNNPTSFEIIDDLGRQVMHLQEREGREIPIDISALRPGNYVLKVIQKDYSHIIRFVKQ